MAEVVEKSFERFLNLPAKLRTGIIDEMEPDDRCRFTRTSKLCGEEAKASKNYVHEVRLSCDSADLAEIIVYYRESDPIFERLGFSLSFSEQSGKKSMEYYLLNDNDDVVNSAVLWKIDLDNSKSLTEHVMEAFRNIMKYSQVSVKVLSLDKSFLVNANVFENDFGITSLKNLEELDVQGPIDIQRILPKIRNPLKKLYIKDWQSTFNFANCEEIYQVKNTLVWWNSYLDNQQLSKISAKKVYTWMGNLTETEVFNFIRSWQNGKIGREIEAYSWDYRRSNFDVRKFLKLLRVDFAETGKIEIQHHKQPGKSAVLRWTNFTLDFNPRLVDYFF